MRFEQVSSDEGYWKRRLVEPDFTANLVDECNDWYVVNPLRSAKWSSVDFIDYEVKVPFPFETIEAFCLAVDAVASTPSDDVNSIKILDCWPPVDCGAEQRHAVALLDPLVGNVVRVHLGTASLRMRDVAPVQNENTQRSLVSR